jgi:hypothetical protein
MPARRLLAACTAATALLTATAHAAEPPKPAETAPEPRVAAEPKQVVVTAIGYEMTADLWKEFQTALDDPQDAGRDETQPRNWTLTPRESRMLLALIRPGR